LNLHRLKTVAVFAAVMCPGFAAAQTPPVSPPTTPGGTPARGYVEAVAQSAFGNVTSQAYGGEFGIGVSTDLQVFVEAAEIRNIATARISAAAQLVAGALAQAQPAAVTYSVKQPVTLVAGGVKYLVPTGSRAIPYALGGFGVARVKNDARFQIGGADAPTALTQFVSIGGDLSGTVTKPLATFGAGLAWVAWKQLMVDFQYRFGVIFADGERINVNRAGFGVGVAF
jgi:opacity protein-like surface antigen